VWLTIVASNHIQCCQSCKQDKVSSVQYLGEIKGVPSEPLGLFKGHHLDVKGPGGLQVGKRERNEQFVHGTVLLGMKKTAVWRRSMSHGSFYTVCNMGDIYIENCRRICFYSSDEKNVTTFGLSLFFCSFQVETSGCNSLVEGRMVPGQPMYRYKQYTSSAS